MNIQNRSIASYTSSFIKENILPSFTDSQKKVALVALAIIALIVSTSFILIRRILRARQENKAPDLEKQKVPEKIQERKQNQAQKEVEPAVKLTEDNNKADAKKEKAEPTPEERQPIDDKASPLQKEQKLDQPQPKPVSQKDVQEEEAPKPIQESVEPAAKEPKPTPSLLGKIFPGLAKAKPAAKEQVPNPVQEKVEPAVKQPEAKKPAEHQANKISGADIVRIICSGRENGKVEESELKHFDEVIKAFNTYKADPSKQEEYGNNNSNLVYVGISDFGKAHGLFYPKFEVFLRYLVVKGEIFAYKNARSGYCLYLNKDAVDNQQHGPNAIDPQKTDTYFDLQKLKELDHQLTQVPVPDLTTFSPAEKTRADDIIKEIKSKYYSRFNAQIHHEFILTANYFQPHQSVHQTNQIMDHLVQQKLIHSWNIASRMRQLAVKLHKDDSLENPRDVYSWDEWRDLDVIKKEEQFKKDNKIVISADSLQKSNLTAIARDNLNALVNNLNKRVKSGPYEWSPTETDAIINLDEINAIRKFLMDHHHVVAFDQKGFRKVYVIAVKEADKP